MFNSRKNYNQLSIAIACFALLTLVGCNSGSKSENAQESQQIIGAGSTFIYPVMTRWIADFQTNH